MMSEARTCYLKSRKFKGRCTSNNNCHVACKQEGFLGGRCKGVKQRCICRAKCPKRTPPGGGGGGGGGGGDGGGGGGSDGGGSNPPFGGDTPPSLVPLPN
ncbi:hypothetical protein U1Q18_000079 [Sarracenia purpurea var. burkii]